MIPFDSRSGNPYCLAALVMGVLTFGMKEFHSV